VTLVEKWWEIERSLPAGWEEARVSILVHGETYARRAAALLGPANPVRSGLRVSVYTAQRGVGIAPKGLARLLTRLDEEGIPAELEISSLVEGDPGAVAEDAFLADTWESLVAGLPEDWSDLYVELALDSSDYLQPGALAIAPLNPARWQDTTAFRFRCARRSGYGASPAMVKRCMERLDERGITGSLQILRALSDSKHVSTQGPVWYVGGRSV
jgi:hypothetical protein